MLVIKIHPSDILLRCPLSRGTNIVIIYSRFNKKGSRKLEYDVNYTN